MPKKNTETLEQKLQAPIEDENGNLAHYYKAQSYAKNKNTGKPFKARFVAYIDARHVAERLDVVFGVLGWSDSYEVKDGVVYCTITVESGDTKASKTDCGLIDSKSEKVVQSMVVKGTSSDAFKRAGVKLGIGRYLYSLESFDIRMVENKKGFSSFEVTQEERDKFEGVRFTHNHPQGDSFSPTDLQFACAAKMKEMRVICKLNDKI